jgi:Leucine-rich repeat (LRR) protein
MKPKILFIIIAFTSFCNAQIINIPDANFKAKLLAATPNNLIASRQTPIIYNGYPYFTIYDSIDSNNDGEIQLSEVQDITYLNLSNENSPNNSSINNLTGLNYFTSLCVFSAVNNNIIDVNFSNNNLLMKINLMYNTISNINLFGLSNLIELLLSNNNLTSINLSGLNNLVSLEVPYNNLSNLSIQNFVNLKRIFCENNNLTNLTIQNCPNLENINCRENQLNTLDLTNLLNLNTLYFNENNLVNLNLSNLTNLETVLGYNNQLESIILTGSNNIKYLFVNDNNLSTIDTNNLTNLQQLQCQFNQLENLDVSQNTYLTQLICNHNNITSLDVSQNYYLNELDCSNNELIQLNIKNSNIYWFPLLFSDNSNLVYICSDVDDISEVEQKIIEYGYTNCHVNSYCSFTPGGAFYSIQGNQNFDYNNNGCDINDIIYPNFKCSITDGTNTGTFIANNSGNYTIPLQSGTHTVTPIIENPTYFNITPNTFNVSFPTSASPYNQDFCITANGQHNDLEIILLPINQVIPGFDAYYK